MAEGRQRVDLRLGEFACSIEGFEAPEAVLRRLLVTLAEEAPRLPALAETAATLDAEARARLLAEAARLSDLPAERLEVLPGLVVLARPAEATESAEDPAATGFAPATTEDIRGALADAATVEPAEAGEAEAAERPRRAAGDGRRRGWDFASVFAMPDERARAEDQAAAETAEEARPAFDSALALDDAIGDEDMPEPRPEPEGETPAFTARPLVDEAEEGDEALDRLRARMGASADTIGPVRPPMPASLRDGRDPEEIAAAEAARTASDDAPDRPASDAAAAEAPADAPRSGPGFVFVDDAGPDAGEAMPTAAEDLTRIAETPSAEDGPAEDFADATEPPADPMPWHEAAASDEGIADAAEPLAPAADDEEDDTPLPLGEMTAREAGMPGDAEDEDEDEPLLSLHAGAEDDAPVPLADATAGGDLDWTRDEVRDGDEAPMTLAAGAESDTGEEDDTLPLPLAAGDAAEAPPMPSAAVAESGHGPDVDVPDAPAGVGDDPGAPLDLAEARLADDDAEAAEDEDDAPMTLAPAGEAEAAETVDDAHDRWQADAEEDRQAAARPSRRLFGILGGRARRDAPAEAARPADDDANAAAARDEAGPVEPAPDTAGDETRETAVGRTAEDDEPLVLTPVASNDPSVTIGPDGKPRRRRRRQGGSIFGAPARRSGGGDGNVALFRPNGELARAYSDGAEAPIERSRAASPMTAQELSWKMEAHSPDDQLICAAAYLTFAQDTPRFSRRAALEVLDGIPGEVVRNLEVRIKNFGKLVREGLIVEVGPDTYELSADQRARAARHFDD